MNKLNDEFKTQWHLDGDGELHIDQEFDEEYHSVWIINPKEFCLSVLQQLREMQNDLPEVIEIRDYLNQLNYNLTKETD